MDRRFRYQALLAAADAELAVLARGLALIEEALCAGREKDVTLYKP